MRCPYCGAQDTKVTDSRLVSDGEQVRRRRECTECAMRFTTYESIEWSYPRIIKRDGTREPFDPQKLRAGVLRALEKRPISSEQIEQALEQIGHRLRAQGEREVPSQFLGECVMDALKKLDEVAYVRFASVYRRFQDVNAFREELERLQNKDL